MFGFFRRLFRRAKPLTLGEKCLAVSIAVTTRSARPWRMK